MSAFPFLQTNKKSQEYIYSRIIFPLKRGSDIVQLRPQNFRRKVPNKKDLGPVLLDIKITFR